MSDEWVMVPREPTEEMIRAGYSAPTVFGVRDMANTYRAMLAAAPDAPQRNREADRARYIDRAFNEWLDDSVADGGATVWDLVSDVHSAWAAWTAHPNYAAPAAPQQAEPCDVCDVCNALTVPRNATRYDADDLKAAQVRGKIIAARLQQQAEPVAQIGWSDEFGNLFPMAAWKPAQRTHHDAHKTAWRPVFLHPPAAEVQGGFDFREECDRRAHVIAYLMAEVHRFRDAAKDVCEWADAAQWALGNETGVPAAKLDALRKALEGGE